MIVDDYSGRCKTNWPIKISLVDWPVEYNLKRIGRENFEELCVLIDGYQYHSAIEASYSALKSSCSIQVFLVDSQAFLDEC